MKRSMFLQPGYGTAGTRGDQGMDMPQMNATLSRTVKLLSLSLDKGRGGVIHYSSLLLKLQISNSVRHDCVALLSISLAPCSFTFCMFTHFMLFLSLSLARIDFAVEFFRVSPFR